ncbi:MAG: tyramine oxidase, partial [Aestuariivirga sp.]|nr:tyramine oxidase [Aestuariivirga sp.]
MTRHPLDPLARDEIAAASAIVRREGGLSLEAWFETIALEEPRRRHEAGEAPPREAFVACYDPATGETWDGVVDLSGRRLRHWARAQGQARIVADEFAAGGLAAKADPRFIEALAKRGITDLDSVLVEAWAAGHFGIAEEEGQRLAYGHCWVRNAAGDNPYARPIANLHPVIDLRNMKLLRLDDFGVVPLP